MKASFSFLFFLTLSAVSAVSIQPLPLPGDDYIPNQSVITNRFVATAKAGLQYDQFTPAEWQEVSVNACTDVQPDCTAGATYSAMNPNDGLRYWHGYLFGEGPLAVEDFEQAWSILMVKDAAAWYYNASTTASTTASNSYYNFSAETQPE